MFKNSHYQDENNAHPASEKKCMDILARSLLNNKIENMKFDLENRPIGEHYDF